MASTIKTRKTRSTKKTRFVPRMILGSAALASVVPAIALIDCGGDSSTGSGPDAAQFGVANNGVAVAAFFDAGKDASQFGVGQGVAVAAFFDSGVDTGPDSMTDGAKDGAETDGSEGGNDSGEG